MLYGISAAVLLVGLLLAFKPTHVLPRTSTTFSMQRVDDLTKFIENYDAEDLDTHANYVMSNFYKINHLHPVGAHKFSVGCYGPAIPVLDLSKLWFQTQSDLTALQTTQDSLSSISVCTCIDAHVDIAFGATEFQSVDEAGFVPAKLSVLVDDYTNRSFPLNAQRMSGNVPFVIADQGQFDKLTEIRNWCAKSAAPVYTMQYGAVFNSRLLLFVGLCFVVVGLDLFEVRQFSMLETEHHRMRPLWLLDLAPLVISIFLLFRWQGDTNLRADNSPATFLLSFMYGLIVLSVLVIVLFSFWANTVMRRKQMLNPLWERIFVDVPMIVGLALVGLALKLQNEEHDEVVLLTTVFILLSGGLVQHISNLVKVVYDTVCMRFETALLLALQTGNPWVHDSKDGEQLDRTRIIMQYFGWTRVYAFFVVFIAAFASWTISSTTSSNHNPLQFFTQNQYVYFIFAYIIALAGLDMFFEALSFVTERDTVYGEVAANRLRKLIIAVYMIFLLGTQYSLESSET